MDSGLFSNQTEFDGCDKISYVFTRNYSVKNFSKKKICKKFFRIKNKCFPEPQFWSFPKHKELFNTSWSVWFGKKNESSSQSVL